jgi:hypothetical protein
MPATPTKYDSRITKPPMTMPKTSVAQLQERAKAEIAAQGGFPSGSDARVDSNLLADGQGVLIARQKAASAVDFDAHATEQRNIENMMTRGHNTQRAREAADATAEGMGLGNSLGSAHAELHPQDREAMEKRATQLKAIVGSRTIDGQMKAGRELQSQYAMSTRQQRAEEANARFGRGLLGRRMGIVDDAGERDALWYHLDGSRHESYPSASTPASSRRSSHDSVSSGGQRRASSVRSGRGLFETSESCRSGYDVGYLPQRT